MWRIAAISLAAAVCATPVVAQQQNSNSDSQSYSGAQVTVQGDTVYGGGKQKIRQDITASGIAPGLTAAGVHSCAGSMSVGGGFTGFNFGAGATYEMVECNRRAYAATLSGMGQNAAALAIVCNNTEVQVALNQTGVMCPQQRAAMAAQQAAAQPEAQQAAYDGRGAQPGVRYIPASGRGGGQLIPISTTETAQYASTTSSIGLSASSSAPPFCSDPRSYNPSLCQGMAAPR